MNFAPLVFAGLALFGGILVAAQGPIYARLSDGLNRDHLLAVFLAFATAAVATGTLALIAGSFRNLTIAALGSLPHWVWLGGLFGAIHVVISMQSIPVLGATLFLIIVVTGNLAGGAIFDHVGAMGLDVRKFSIAKGVGMMLVLAGVTLVARA